VHASRFSGRFAAGVRLLLIVLVLGLELFTASRAAADADPASDILLGSQVFYPYQPAVSKALQRQLAQKLTALKANGMNLKVAIVQGPVDLGALPNIFGKPQQYAEFLDREISFKSPQPLLVVMPDGFGVSHAGRASALDGLKIDTSQKSNGLAAAAIHAVDRIAKANGKSTAGRSASGSGGGGTSPLITFGIPIVVILGALGTVVMLRRRAGGTERARRGRAPSSRDD
jgi:hypothetical protein